MADVMNKQNNSSDKNSSNKGSHVDDIVDVSNVVHEIDNSED